MLHQAMHDSLQQFTTENGRDYVIGYSTADHLGGEQQFPLWHKHVTLGIHRLLASDQTRWTKLRDKNPQKQDLLPFLRGKPLLMNEENMERVRSSWTKALSHILNRKITKEKDLVIKRARKDKHIQTREADTERLSFYNSATSHDPYRYVFKISRGGKTILMEPREGVSWKNRPVAPFLENMDDFVRNRLLAPLRDCVRRSYKGYMHPNHCFYQLMKQAQEFGLLEEHYQEIADQGLTAAGELGWAGFEQMRFAHYF